MTPSPRAVGLLAASAAAAFVVPAAWAVGLAVVVVAATLVDAWFARPEPVVTRTLPAHVARGQAMPFRVVVEPRPGQQVRVRQPQLADVRFEPSEAQEGIDGTVVALRRGRYVLPPVAVRTTGPLGLGRWTHAVGGDATLHSHPDLPAARRLATAVRRGSFRDPGFRPGALGLGTDFETIRELTPDDDVRRVNWLATERLERPMVNQYREDTERDLWCLVDLGRTMTAPLRDRTRLDVALDVLAALAAVADAVGDRVGAVAFDDEVRRVVAPRRAGGEGLLRSLYDVEPRPVDSDHDRAFHRVARAKRSLVVVLTDLVDEAAVEPLREALPTLARRHAVLVVGAEDPDLREAVTRAPQEARDVHAAVVAGDVLAGRDRVVGDLRSAGCTVVETPADRLPSAAVAAYLSLKARARL